MRKTDCNICDKKAISLNDTIKIDGKVYCDVCFETHFANQQSLEDKLVEKEADPTICSSCGKDFGETELNKISTYPICSDCEIAIKNKTFPTWVKGFFIGILVIVVGSFIWNWKFYMAYQNLQKSFETFQKGDYKQAGLLVRSASEVVPEAEDLKTLVSYFQGIDLLTNDKSTQALIELEKCKDKMPADYNIPYLILQARSGSAFDHKEYDGFLEASKEILALDSASATTLGSVASAYACLYADKGNEEDKQSSLNYLRQAQQIDSVSPEMKTYYNMIVYRLYTRKVIKREEFERQFPNGWTK